MDALYYLDQLDLYLKFNDSLEESEIPELTFMLRHHDPLVVARAGACLMNSNRHQDVVLKVLPTLPLASQKIMSVLVASSNNTPSYVALLTLLRDTPHQELADLLILSLVKTPYPIFPLVLDFLNDTDERFRSRLRDVVSQMLPSNLFPFLALFPVIPHEAFFRDALGDDAIDHIYQKQ